MVASIQLENSKPVKPTAASELFRKLVCNNESVRITPASVEGLDLVPWFLYSSFLHLDGLALKGAGSSISCGQQLWSGHVPRLLQQRREFVLLEGARQET